MKKRFNLDTIKNFIWARLTGVFKWLYPGIGIKRWIGLGIFGFILVVVGSNYLRDEEFWFIKSLDAVVVVSGIIILILGIKRIIRSFLAAFLPSSKDVELVDILYHRSQIGRGPRVVVIGGGTGLSVLLSGLKEYTSNITAIVTVADDGGSSGRLRQQFDMLPPGDIRNCLVALADTSGLMRELFQFRFESGSELAGHNFGNLFITAMTRLTGDFEKAIKETSKVLALRGEVIPSTLGKVALVAKHKDGSSTIGENKIPKAHKPIESVHLEPADSQATPEAIRAIEQAQLIVLGPGSLYTSVIPNLLIEEISDALAKSSAAKVYVCNAMSQPGETDNFSASDHIKALVSHANARVLDRCIINTGEISSEVLKRYAKQNSYPVTGDIKNIEKMGYQVIGSDIIITDGVIRHDPKKLAKIILGIIEEVN